MITVLDNTPWSDVLIAGNAAFVDTAGSTSSGFGFNFGNNFGNQLSALYIVSNTRNVKGFGQSFGDGFGTASQDFVILGSNPVPPDPGPGATFSRLAQYQFPIPTGAFDPVCALDFHSVAPLSAAANASAGNTTYTGIFTVTIPNGTNVVISGFTQAANNGTFNVVSSSNNQLVVNNPSGIAEVRSAQVAYYTTDANKLHIVGTRTNALNPNVTDLIKFTYDLVAGTLTGPLLLASTGIKDAYDIAVLQGGYKIIVVGVHDPGNVALYPATLPQGDSLIAIELDQNDNFVQGGLNISETGFGTNFGFNFGQDLPQFSPRVIVNSPDRSGDTYSSVSVICADGVNVEVYYESHPKLVSFQDQVFKLWSVQGSGGAGFGGLFGVAFGMGWNQPVQITQFTGRFTDDKLTVIQNGQDRLLTQVYYNQIAHPQGLIGNLLTGYFSHTTLGWIWQTQPGTVAASFVQATPAVDTQGDMHIAYLVEPLIAPPLLRSWPLHVASVDSNLNFVDIPAWYNGQNFTWLRGTKNTMDASSLWGIVGERETAPNTNSPTYVSFFNVPPTVSVAPTSAVVYRGAVGYNIGQGLVPGDLTITATSADSEQSPLKYVWTKDDQDTLDITLNPSIVPSTSNTAVLDVKRSVGGAARTFTVGVATIDYNPDLVTPIHPPLPVTNIDVTGTTLTVSAVNNLAVGEQVMLYNLVIDAPASVNKTTAVSGSQLLRTYYIRLTYINPAGESLGSVEVTQVVPANSVLKVQPTATAWGDATAFNVYVSTTTNTEQLQTITPVPLGTFWQEPDGGLITGVPVPTASTAFLPKQFNDFVATISNTSGSTFTVFGFAAPAGTWHGAQGTFSGAAIVQFQFATTQITVPANAAPAIGTLPPIAAMRNSVITLAPTITGVSSDVDDLPGYVWSQISGTPVQNLNGVIFPSFQFSTAGVNVHGETLTFQLVASDGVNPSATQTFTVNVAAYNFTSSDTLFLARALFGQSGGQGFGQSFGNGFGGSIATISQRNSNQSWGSLMVSSMLTNFNNVKRTSVLDGSDRYIVISPFSVLVYGGVHPNEYLMRKLLTPNNTLILDAVHTEQDYTLVLDANFNLFRYSTAPLINTDNPDTTVILPNISSFRFNKLFTTPTFADIRVLLLSGPDGLLLLQVRSSTLEVLASFEMSTTSGFVYGSNNVQFVRTSGVESVRQGKVLIGTIDYATATITTARVASDNAIFSAVNNFQVGNHVVLSGITHIPDLNGRKLVVTLANATGFECSVLHTDAGTLPYTDTGTATATDNGVTYETLVDLVHGQIIGTWDASKLRNQRVESGEILFEQESTYVGRPPAPIQSAPTKTGANVTISWAEERPDLVFAYDVQDSVDNGVTWNVLQRVAPGATQQLNVALTPGVTYLFRIQAFSVDGASNFSNIESITV